MKKIAVVLLNWNGQKLLEQFLPSVVLYSKEANIYIADNASTDWSKEYVLANYPEIKWISNQKNLGYAQGYNEALEDVEEEFYILLNTDIEVTENWLLPMLDLAESNKEIAIIQPKILDFKDKEYFEYAGAAGGFIDKYGYAFCRGRIFETLEKDLGQYNNVQEIFWASGACFFIRKSVFKELHGFDADFFAHQEEIDLCWRAKNLGKLVYFTPNSRVYHVGGATLQKSNEQKTYLNFRNSLFMLTKNLPKQSLFGILLVRMILDGLAGIQFLLQGKLLHFIAVLKAHKSFYLMAGKMYKKRKTETTEDYFLIKNILFHYFFKRKQTFLDLFNRKL